MLSFLPREWRSQRKMPKTDAKRHRLFSMKAASESSKVTTTIIINKTFSMHTHVHTHVYTHMCMYARTHTQRHTTQFLNRLPAHFMPWQPPAQEPHSHRL